MSRLDSVVLLYAHIQLALVFYSALSKLRYNVADSANATDFCNTVVQLLQPVVLRMNVSFMNVLVALLVLVNAATADVGGLMLMVCNRSIHFLPFMARCLSQDTNAAVKFGPQGDVNIYRAAAGTLQTDGTLIVEGTAGMLSLRSLTTIRQAMSRHRAQ